MHHQKAWQSNLKLSAAVSDTKRNENNLILILFSLNSIKFEAEVQGFDFNSSSNTWERIGETEITKALKDGNASSAGEYHSVSDYIKHFNRQHSASECVSGMELKF